MDARIENLNSGVLLKLLQEMNDDEKKDSNGDGNPVLLQIRSIIPVSADGDFWPEQGFYLKVSDSSHVMYVSLPHQQGEMVLCNKLQLGQLIFVDKLKPAYPVPILKGVVPVPGRHPCNGDLQDLDSIDGVADLEAVLNFVSKVDAKSSVEEKATQKIRSSSAPKVRPIDIGRGFRFSDANNGSQALSSTSVVDKYCESDMLGTSTSLPTPRRKNWNTKEILDSIHVIKHGWKPTGRSRSACPDMKWNNALSFPGQTSPIRASKYERSPENSRLKTRAKDTGRSTKSVKNSHSTSASAKTSENNIDSAPMLNLVKGNKREECKILWNSLPPSLIKHGKEVLRNKEAAMLAAVDALQEASACDRILKCLSTYSEIQCSKMPCQQLSVDKFFNLQDNLTQTLMVFQSLKSISPLKETDEIDNNSKSSISEALKLASERKRNATSWINLALECDLSSLSSDSNSKLISVSKQATEATSTSKRSNVNTGHKPKGMSLVKMQRGNGDEQLGLGANNSPPEWERGNSIDAASELANSLRDECAKWFLEHVEKYLDEADQKAATKSDFEVAEVMRQIKKVNDWLDNWNKCKDGLEDDELEAYGRLRDKIFSILLKNLERTAVALENTNAPSSG